MINAMLGIKKVMTSTYDARGRRVGATVIEINPNYITQTKKASGKDGYDAVQLGFGTRKSVKKPQIGHAKKAGVEKKLRFLKEVRIQNKQSLRSNDLKELSLKGEDLGKEINIGDVFSVGDAVKVTGFSKGRGFAGVVKRHGFAGGPKTHGQSDRHRAPGSIGAGTTPGRVYKGKKMAGHMGAERVTVRGLEIVGIDKDKKQLTVKGGIPGFTGSMVIITKLGKIKGYTPPPEEKPEEEEEAVSKQQTAGSQESGESENQQSETGEKGEVEKNAS